MLEEFILGQLEEIESKKEDLKRQLNDLVNQETEDNEEISKLLKEQDLGFELFSPRSVSHSVRDQVETIKNHIEELRVGQAQIRGDLEQITINENRYQKMLLEARQREAVSAEPNLSHDSVKNKADTAAVDEYTDHAVSINLNNETKVPVQTDSQQDTGEYGIPYESENNDSYSSEQAVVESINKEHIHQLETILKRVDQCIDLSHRDKIKCRNELKNLKYYMKALISKNQR